MDAKSEIDRFGGIRSISQANESKKRRQSEIGLRYFQNGVNSEAKLFQKV